jgi:hypothetical protein
MASNQDKMVKAVVDGLSDSRTNYGQSMNAILAEADRNDNLQAYLWGFIVTYIYNRAGRWRLGITHTPNQEHVASICNEIVDSVLDSEYGPLGSIPVPGNAYSAPEIKLI